MTHIFLHPRALGAMLAACGFLIAPARAALLGNDPAIGGVLDGFRAIMVVNESDTYTNLTTTPQTVTATQFNVNIGAARGRVTPFIVRVDGNDAFTVVAIGRTRVAGTDYMTTGVKTFSFADTAIQLTLAPGEKIAGGYTDAAAGGSGNDGSVVPYVDGNDEIWLTGGVSSGNAGSVTVGSAPAPQPAGSTLNSLFRQYAFNINVTTPIPPGGTITMGNNPSAGGELDGWSAIMAVNENDTYTNNSSNPEIVTVTQFNFRAGAARGRVTPFVVRVNGNDSFSVLAIGRTRTATTDYPAAGVKNFAFADVPPTFILQPGQKIAPGFTDANPDGTGNAGSVIPFVDGGDQIWLTGGVANSNAGSIALNAMPQAGAGAQVLTGLTRQYSFHVAFTAQPPGPLPPNDIQLAALDIFPGLVAGSFAGALSTSDPNPGDTHTYALVNSAGGFFTLDGAVLRTAQPPGATGTVYTVRVRSTDQGGLSFEKDLAFTVAAPAVPLSLVTTARSIVHGTPVGAVLGQLATLDPNPADAFIYTFVSGAGAEDNALFLLEGANLKLAAPVPAGRASLSLRVRSTDRAGLFIEAAFTLSVLEAGVRINEYLSTSDSGLRDEEDAAEDWIELHNPLTVPVNLAGWRLTDDADDLAKWTIPARTLAPGGFLVVFASGKNRAPASGNLHTNFRLDGSTGEWFALVRPDGTIADAFAAQEQFTDLSFGWQEAGTGRGYMTPTPNATNGSAFPFGLNEVAFSVRRGFYNSPQSLVLTATVPASVIRYTTDGTRPSVTNGTVYNGPIAVLPDTAGATRGTRRIRAVALHDNAAANRVATHTYLFINGATAPATDGVVGQTNTNNAAQTNAIRSNPAYAPLLDDALTALSAVSINSPSGAPGTSETEASIEFFHPSGTEPGFHIDCGIQAVGNTSLASPKNNFRLYMRSEYGQPKLNHNIFRDHPYAQFHPPARTFDRIALRGGSHDSFHWMADTANPPMAGFRGDALYLRAVIMDDMHLNFGHIAMHNRFVQLWLNGRYQGLYHWREYPNDDFMASYRTGGDEDFEFTNGANPGENGSAAWQTAWNQMRTAVNTSYTEAARWIDLPQLADFIILNFWAGNAWDWNPNQNWMAAGPRLPDRGGWIFFSYDNDVIWNDPAADLTIPSAPNYVNNPRPGIMPPDGLAFTTPTTDTTLMDHLEFRMIFRDRFYKACFHGGPLTTARAQAILDHRVAEISLAMIAETARWQPGSATALPWDRDGEWMTEVNRLRNDFMVSRCGTILAQVRARGWYPVEAPEFAQHGGAVPPGHQPAVSSATPGTIVYATLDGSDPRLTGGFVRAGALALTVPPPPEFAVNDPVLIRMRARRSDGEWSPLNEAAFFPATTVPASAENIVFSEIHYNTSAVPAGQTEFIEVMNAGSGFTDLSGCYFTSGLDFVFPPGSVLAPGQRMTVNEGQFLNGTGLSNGGERLRLVQPAGTAIRDFEYDDELPWPREADGEGSSLVLIAPSAATATDPWHANALNWRPSTSAGGNPGTGDGTSFAAWKAVHGIIGDLDDGDDDGLSALAEYATGSHPAEMDMASLPVQVSSPGGPLLRVLRSAGIHGVTMVPQFSSDLTGWTEPPLSITSRSTVNGIEQLDFALPQDQPRAYWRMRIVLAP